MAVILGSVYEHRYNHSLLTVIIIKVNDIFRAYDNC